jgi:Icc-related predicted phosphoesterase
MKTLVVSDAVSEVLYSREIRSVCAGVELVLSCGDLPYEYLEYIVTCLDVPLLYVPGNHDGALMRSDGRVSDGPEGGRSIDRRVVRVCGRRGEVVWIAGFGGSAACGGGIHQHSEREMGRRVRSARARLRFRGLVERVRLGVVVSHAAPRGVHDAEDPCHRGFASFVDLMRRERPQFWLHGHIHPSYGIDLRPVQCGPTEVRGIYGYEMLEIE